MSKKLSAAGSTRVRAPKSPLELQAERAWVHEIQSVYAMAQDSMRFAKLVRLTGLVLCGIAVVVSLYVYNRGNEDLALATAVLAFGLGAFALQMYSAIHNQACVTADFVKKTDAVFHFPTHTA